MFKTASVALVALTGFVCVGEALAATSVTSTTAESAATSTSLAGVNQRLKRIERVLENQVMLEMLQRIESLQIEVRELRGEIESQGFELQSMRKQQRDLYLDTDRRLRDLELVGSAPNSQSSGVTIEPTETAPSGGDATAALNTAGTNSTGTIASFDPAQEKAAYTDAFNYLKEGRYEGAIKAFGQFLQNYPNGNYADNAQYWLGEANYVSRFYDVAIKEFKTVVSKYPASPKIADARLKIGYVHYELKNWQAARDALTALESDFPGTSVARLANKRLARMRDEGH